MILTSDPELISTETLFRSLANVTFFSNLASDIWAFVVEVDAVNEFSENVVSLTSLSESGAHGLKRFSDMSMSSSKLI